MFDGRTEHKDRKTELADARFFYEIAYFFYCFFLFIFFNDLINKC